MINLMPYDAKKQIRAARMNIILFRNIIILGFSVIFLSLACAVTYYFISSNKTETTMVGNGSSIQKQADTIRTNLATAKNILDRQIIYNNVITGIAAALPTGTMLDSIILNDNSFGSSTNLTVLARSSSSEAKLKENFSNSTLFSNYKLVSNGANQKISTEYPFSIIINLTINRTSAQ